MTKKEINIIKNVWLQVLLSYWTKLWIQMQNFKWIRIRIQDFDDQKLKKKIQMKNFLGKKEI